MAFSAYIEKLSSIQKELLSYLEDLNNNEDDFQAFLDSLKKSEIMNNKKDFEIFLYSLLTISNNHHRHANFFTKIEQILKSLSNDIKNNFTKSEIFNLFKENKKIILFLIEEGILINDDSFLTQVIEHSNKEKDYLYYFYPEMLPNPPEKFNENRKIGENSSYICSLIRQDLVEEFVSYINKINLKLIENVEPSIFETNKFLIGKKVSLIQYAAFFGSIQIFQYLRYNNVKLSPSLWLFAIHSNNAEMINLLEESQIKPDDDTYKKCFNEAVKCHHNDIANYFSDYFLQQQCSNYYSTIKYYNFSLIQNHNKINEFFLFGLCKKDYVNMVELLLNEKEIDINKEII
ncbi:hypothetical protein M9Y10_003097 [Tritrichomonas musculus]|uniref:DUF3447 domain-containing protein n=1 Tax=Tritrichomonas musculus TaxID=1915356 RepID=A0ABR2JNL7_9EUKA